MRRLAVAAALAALTLLGGVRCAFAQADVALVLAVDVSASVTDARFKLQREGMANALDSDALAAALAGGANQAVEIAVVEWAEDQVLVLPWTVVRQRSDLAELAQKLRRAPRAWVHTKTDPGGGIAAADALFASAPLKPDRKVIDVSGDGINNNGRDLAAARAEALATGLTINGLPILWDYPELDTYYRDNVIGGPGAFAVVAHDFGDFGNALLGKLVREIAGTDPLRRYAETGLQPMP